MQARHGVTCQATRPCRQFACHTSCLFSAKLSFEAVVFLLLPLSPQVAGIYRQVTYHNFYHCTDVTHTTFMFIK